ncbi:MAG: tRNA glutamyl-Q(34) synthetase GluQRS [Gammaproteobacteria bacterium]|nr:MAG: tRNA glutamyl-Q(34) synthetase GluQRS [Gammaproteobacteria bacterium]
MSLSSSYRGRFAPSPTGPLHFGSLVAAVGSYLQAKHQNGEWFVRIDDIDPPREQKGAADDILKTLEAFGFEWDQSVLYQSSRLKHYQEVVDHLIKQQLAYPCSCSRTSILKKTGQTKGETIYPGFCRNRPLKKSSEYSIRLNCNNALIRFNDPVQGKQTINLDKQVGDFIIQRRDQLFSYQLASGLDDAEQGITEVVRGADLLSCTPSHLHVQHVLNLPSPQYCHLPIALNDAGQKLSKQNHAKAIFARESAELLYKTLKFLGQMPSIHLMKANQEDIWSWAKTHWQLERVPKKLQLESKA